ncbi:hypothetical protein BST61_g11141 [Cercospora zeina]
MDEARKAVEAFMARNGRHDTTVHETVAPAVTQEVLTRREHQDITRAVDKEFHQDHYHTSVQPITTEEHREEQHHALVQPVDEHNFEHDDPAETTKHLAAVDAEHRDTFESVVAERTTTELPTLEGQHIHHHPVIQKQTFEYHVFHVVVPVREIHHNAAQHYASSSLPTVTLDDFKRAGGQLNGREERYDAFEGEPRSVGQAHGSPLSAAPNSGSATDSSASAPKTPADGSAAAPPAGPTRVATFANPLTTTPNPAAAPQADSSALRAPARAPTAPANLAGATATAPAVDNSAAPPAPAAADNAATAQPTNAAATNAPAAPAPAPLTRDPAAPASLNGGPGAGTLTMQPGGSIAANHPLMRPPTLLSQDAYRQGPGRAGAVRPHARHPRSRPIDRYQLSHPSLIGWYMAPSLKDLIDLIDRQPRPHNRLHREPNLHDGRPVEYVSLAPRADGGDTIAPSMFPPVAFDSNGFRLRLPTNPRPATPTAPEIDKMISGDEMFGDPFQIGEARTPTSMKRRRDSAFPESSREASGLENDSEPGVGGSPVKKLKVDASPSTERISPQTPASTEIAISAASTPDAAPFQGTSTSGPTQASTTPSAPPAEPTDAAPFQGTSTSTQLQSSTTPAVPSANKPNAPAAQTKTAPATRELSLHRDMPPYVGARSIPPWLTHLANEIRSANTDPSTGRIKNGSLKKITTTFNRVENTLSHFSPASGVLRVGQRYSPLWEWWMDTRVLTPSQWWAVNEVIWKSQKEGYKELPAGCLRMQVLAEV